MRRFSLLLTEVKTPTQNVDDTSGSGLNMKRSQRKAFRLLVCCSWVHLLHQPCSMPATMAASAVQCWHQTSGSLAFQGGLKTRRYPGIPQAFDMRLELLKYRTSWTELLTGSQTLQCARLWVDYPDHIVQGNIIKPLLIFILSFLFLWSSKY